MKEGHIKEDLSLDFSQIPPDYFTMSQYEDYYINVVSLGNFLSVKIFKALNDLAYNLDKFNEMENEQVVKSSLLRGISTYSVKNQLHRIAHGGAKLTDYSFKFTPFIADSIELNTNMEMDFNVRHDSFPSSNIHVIIGRNGTGKTSVIRNMINTLINNVGPFGSFTNLLEDNMKNSDFKGFANVIFFAYSPFEDFTSFSNDNIYKIDFSYIGLNLDAKNLKESMSQQFITSFNECMGNAYKKRRWSKVVEYLESDPTFIDMGIKGAMVIDNILNYNLKEEIKSRCTRMKAIFNSLSSGHKVILLTITSCVEKLEERSIIFLDEPENHLHPPLVSSFMKALSYLLLDRNSVAIISTHSPVVLQEVPKKCVYKISKSGNSQSADRLVTETYGSSISALTREIFGLEVNKTGFIETLKKEVDACNNFNDIMNKYDNQLGDEAIALVHTLFFLKEQSNESAK